MTRTLFVFISGIRIELQELRFWLILFASVFGLKNCVWRGLLHFCYVAEPLEDDESPGDGRFVLGTGL
jgi:hypothetical protein